MSTSQVEKTNYDYQNLIKSRPRSSSKALIQYGVTTRESSEKKYPRTLILGLDPELPTPTESRHTTSLLGGKSSSVKLMSRRENKELAKTNLRYTDRTIDRVLGQGLKSECADIFYQSFFWLLRHTDEPQRGRNSWLWLQSRGTQRQFSEKYLFGRRFEI